MRLSPGKPGIIGRQTTTMPPDSGRLLSINKDTANQNQATIENDVLCDN